jgi:molecular chaperone GrpE
LELEAEVERLTKELTAEKEQYMRKAADMDNYRKRLIREKEAAVQFANERLLQDLIPILDDFDRAVEAVSQAPDVQVYAHGIELIRKQLLEMLNRNWGLKRMDDIVGKEFSPHEHEAMMMEESDEYDTETVLAELQKGYYLHDRVLRTAKVKVGKPQ